MNTSHRLRMAWLILFAILPIARAAMAADIHAVEMHFYDGSDSLFWSQAVSGTASVDKLLLAPGEPVTARFHANGPSLAGGFKQTVAAVFALNISDGDAELMYEGRESLIPATLPPLLPIDWRPLPTTQDKDTVTASTTDLPPGVYRMRLAAAEGAVDLAPGHAPVIKPSPKVGLRGDFFVVIASSPHSLDTYTEQRRHVYYRGETIPATILLRSTGILPAGRADVEVWRGSERIGRRWVKLPLLTTESRRVPVSIQTRDLAPGQYGVTIDYAGMTASWSVEIVDPIGPSVIAISECQLGGAPWADPMMAAAFGWPGADSALNGYERPYADFQVTSFRNEMMQGVSRSFNQKLADTLEQLHAGPAAERVGLYDLRQPWMDGMTRLRMGYWSGIQGRGLSFTKANTLPGTDDEIRRQLIATSRDFGAWANYLGPQVDVDCAFVMGERQLGYAGIPDNLVKAFQARMIKAQDTAFHAEFPKEIAAAGTDAIALRKLWGDWYRSVWPRTDAKDKAALALLDPTLFRNVNREYHHGTPHSGQYAPDLYSGVDVHNVEAWGDPCDNVLFPDSWANMGAAARRVYGRTDQPLWIESQSYFHDAAGYMQTRWWGVLANGADGVGYAANVFGLRGWSGIDPYRPNLRRQTAVAMASMVRTLGPALRVLDRERRVALLFSKTEADSKGGDYWYIVHCLDTYPPFATYAALTVAGYQPDFIFDEQIVHGELDRYQVLYLQYQQYDMSSAVKAAVDKFVSHGGKVVIDACSDVKRYPNAVPVAVNPMGFKATVGGFGWAWVDASVPTLRKTLDPLVTPLPGRVDHPRCVVYWLRHGDGCRYAIVINEGYAPVRTVLRLNEPMGGYDLMTGQRINPTTAIDVDLRNLSARLYAFTPAPIGLMAVSATPKATAGEPVEMTARLLDENRKPMSMIAPARFRIMDALGRVRWERWTPIGPDTTPAVWETAASEEPGKYTATITELISGKTATFPITLRRGNAGSLIEESTETLTEAIDRRALGELWQTQAPPGAEWSVVLKADQAALAPLADELVVALRRRGLHAQVWHNPETIPMPVGYLFTPEQQKQRDRVFAGEAIGERVYIHPEAPYAPTWEPRTGTAIYRNVVFLEIGTGSPIRVGVREFSGNHDAVFLRGGSEADLRGVIGQALALRSTDENVGPDAGREAFAHGYLLNQSGGAGHDHLVEPVGHLKQMWFNLSDEPIGWSDQIGRAILKIDVSPNRQNILATHEGLLNVVGQFTADGVPVRAIVQPSSGDGGDTIRGVDNDGTIAVAADAYTIRSLHRSGGAGPERPATLWASADNQDRLRYEPYTVNEKDAQGKPQPVAKRKLLREHGTQTVFASGELGAAPGILYPSPNGKYLFQPDDGQTRNIGLTLRFVRMHDGMTGKLLWEKKNCLAYPGVFASSISWSADGEYFTLVRNFPVGDYHGIWPDLSHRCMISIIRASDGAVMVEGAPTTWVEKMLISGDGRFAVGVPAFMSDHYWLLEAGKGMTKVTVGNQCLYDVTLDATGKQVFTLDMGGVLRRHQPTGEVLWSHSLHIPGGPLLGVLKPFGDDLLLGSTAGKLFRLSGNGGNVIWQRASTDSLDGKMVGGL